MTKGIVSTIIVLFFTQGFAQQISKIDSMLKFYEQTENLNGVMLIAKEGEVVYQHAFGYANMEWQVKNTIATRFKTASVSKLFTVVLCFQLFEKGLLAPGHTIGRYIPGYPRGDKITVHQLLTHTSGITDHRGIRDYNNKHGMTRATREDWMQVFKDSALKFEPGSGWYYSNFGYNLLAMIIEKVTGKSLAQNLSDNIFKPAGMFNSYTMEAQNLIEHLASGYTRRYSEVEPAQYYDGSGMAGAGSLISTAGDLHAFFKALKGGRLIRNENLEAIYSKLYKDEFGDYTAYNGRYFMQRLPGNDSTEITFFSGNHYGTHALVYDERKTNTLLILLLNVKSEKLFEMADNTLNILFSVPFEWPKDSYVRLFAKDISAVGVEKAIEKLKQNKRELGANLSHAPRDLNRLGYFYLDKGDAATAVEIFKLNLEYFQLADFYDSLGEAYMRLGEKEKSKENLRKAIEMDPANDHAKKLLEQLQQ